MPNNDIEKSEITVADWSESTTGLCPVCLASVPATLFREKDQIYLRQQCVRHGDSTALIASDAEEYLRLRTYVPPRVSGGCCCGPGDSCDIGKPPTCILILEITNACNLACPTCYADAHGHEFMSLDEVRSRLDMFFSKQPLLDVLMLSGGEPTIHPQFIELLDIVLNYPVNRVLINTNGLRIAQSDTLLSQLSIRRRRIELYLSLSSFNPETHKRLYGKDLLVQKAAAFDAAERGKLFVNVVATVESGVNDSELGSLFRFCLSKPNINGLILQPAMNNGRYRNEYDPLTRTTLTGAITNLCDQSEGALIPKDFVGLPCSHPDCAALTYGFLDSERKVLTPLPRHLDVARYIDLFSDRISFHGMLQSAVARLWEGIKCGQGLSSLRDIWRVLSLPGLCSLLPLIGRQDQLGSRIFRVVVKPFMDAHTYDSRRTDQCCTRMIDNAGNTVSFCDYNIFQRGSKAGNAAIPLPMLRK